MEIMRSKVGGVLPWLEVFRRQCTEGAEAAESAIATEGAEAAEDARAAEGAGDAECAILRPWIVRGCWTAKGAGPPRARVSLIVIVEGSGPVEGAGVTEGTCAAEGAKATLKAPGTLRAPETLRVTS